MAAWAGVLLSFVFDAADGDLVVHPSRAERTVAVGRLVNDYFFDASGLHCRRARWMLTGMPRDDFSAGAKKSMSNRCAFFAVRDSSEFQAWLRERNIR